MLYKDPAFLDGATCLRLRRAMDEGVVEQAEVLDDVIEPRDDVRRTESIEVASAIVDDVERRLEAQRDRIAEFFGVALKEQEGAGFLRYHLGGFYKPHRDRADVPSWPDAARRSIALVVFLNASREGNPGGEFLGGLLRLHGEDGTVDVRPREGLLVAFPADVLHEVTEVIGGTRDTIVNWFYGGGNGGPS